MERRRILVLALLAAAMVSWQAIRDERTMPAPFRFAGIAVFYGAMGVLAEVAAPLAFWIALGATLQIGYNVATSGAEPDVGDSSGKVTSIAGRRKVGSDHKSKGGKRADRRRRA